MAVSKVNYGDETLIDLTSDTVTPETLSEGVTAHNAAGESITGTMSSVGSSIDEVYIMGEGETETDIPDTAEIVIFTDDELDTTGFVTGSELSETLSGYVLQSEIPSIPTPTTSDNGKFVTVDGNGNFVLTTIPTAEGASF